MEEKTEVMEVKIDPYCDYTNWEGCLEWWFAKLIRDNNVSCTDQFQWDNPKVKEISKDTWERKVDIDEATKLIENYFKSLEDHI